MSIFSIGFRPFFLVTSLIASIYPFIWVLMFSDKLSVYPNFLLPNDWHAHEMIFGMGGALITGFLLTASANWTGKEKISGYPLAILSFFWITERISFFSSLNNLLFIFIQSLFIITFLIFMIKMLKGHSQFKVIIPLILIFLFGKIFFLSSSVFDLGFDLMKFKSISLYILRFLIILISGRILPFFTRKRFPQIVIDKNYYIEKAVLISSFILIFPIEGNIYLNTFYQLMLLIALTSNFVRFYKYRTLDIKTEPMLLILHLGYFWLIIHFLFLILESVFPNELFSFIGFHSFSVGVLGSFAIGMMSRVSLGHSGRKIVANKYILTLFMLVQLAAIVRVFFPVIIGIESINEIYLLSSIFWGLAFFGFFLKFLPILSTPRK